MAAILGGHNERLCVQPVLWRYSSSCVMLRTTAEVSGIKSRASRNTQETCGHNERDGSMGTLESVSDGCL